MHSAGLVHFSSCPQDPIRRRSPQSCRSPPQFETQIGDAVVLERAARQPWSHHGQNRSWIRRGHVRGTNPSRSRFAKLHDLGRGACGSRTLTLHRCQRIPMGSLRTSALDIASAIHLPAMDSLTSQSLLSPQQADAPLMNSLEFSSQGVRPLPSAASNLSCGRILDLAFLACGLCFEEGGREGRSNGEDRRTCE